MPQREAPSVFVVGLLAVLAAFAAAWLSAASETLLTGLAASATGHPWSGIHFRGYGLPAAEIRPSEGTGAGVQALVLLAGPVGAVLVAGGVERLGALVGAPWVRVVALEWLVVAWLGFPLTLLSVPVPGARGPVSALYARLGDPETGRWAAVVLGALALWGAGRYVAARAVGTGRGWMRVDGPGFRRRLVRVFAVYPFAVALALLSLDVPMAGPGWLAGYAALVLAALSLGTR